MIDSILQQECNLEFFHTNGYVRKKCKSCQSYFWTLDSSAELCGDQPCVPFSFIGKPTAKKQFTLSNVRNSFISFFENNNHSKVTYPKTGHRCPVIARWRTDIYLTIASIADFQPHITSGIVPPPSNPLVISQPCIRLNDLEEVGKSGRHLTMFEMMGHHAFNKEIDEIYWKNETVAYCNTFFQQNIGIPQEAINYKEQLWIGGGNAGPCIEVLAGGLEIATLVFMNMKEDPAGPTSIEGKQYTQNPLNIVDTGYGLERIAWFTQGTPTIYETVLPEMITFLTEHAQDTSDKSSIYALADHTKCLAFMLGDGIVPSNVKSGYLARLIIRRSLRFLEKIKLQTTLRELVDIQLDLLKSEFPSLAQQQHQIDEILDIETQRFSETLTKGNALIKRLLQEKKTIDKNALIMLYDTHGMPPDVVQNIAKNEGVQVHIPKNFDSMIAQLHSHAQKEEIQQETKTNLPSTQALYYDDHYQQEFDAKVLWKNKTPKGTAIILDKTVFYPEGGGQPADKGILTVQGNPLTVTHVEKQGEAIIHHVDKDIALHETVHGKIDWEHRYNLMKHHTGTHAVNGALRTLLGDHIWQAGSQLAVNEARFDFSHYKSISKEEYKEIEKLANSYIQQAVPVEKKVMERNDAENAFGFRLYQGGVPPGNHIRVLHIPGVDVEACGGMHVNNTQEIEKIRIKKIERIQDGVNRVIFAAGKMVDQFQKEEQELFTTLTKVLSEVYEIEKKDHISEQLQEVSSLFSVPADQLEKTIHRFLNQTKNIDNKKVNDLPEACTDLFNQWKQTQKQKKTIPSSDIKTLKKNAVQIPGTSIQIVIGKTHSDSVATAVALVEEPNIIAHIYDGKKITSAASKNIDINLNDIAPEIGKILGGSGGGKPKLTQSGGPQKENINQALDKAKELTMKKLQN